MPNAALSASNLSSTTNVTVNSATITTNYSGAFGTSCYVGSSGQGLQFTTNASGDSYIINNSNGFFNLFGLISFTGNASSSVKMKGQMLCPIKATAPTDSIRSGSFYYNTATNTFQVSINSTPTWKSFPMS
jgi:hypothetical protein